MSDYAVAAWAIVALVVVFGLVWISDQSDAWKDDDK